HLGNAVARLYERYAEMLPDGPARTRAAAIARSAALALQLDAEALAPGIEVVDHRILGTWSARGAEEVLRHTRALLDLADVALRDDDILALRPDAFLVSRIFCGSDRASGGTYEVGLLALCAFGADGLLTRIEAFEPDRAAQALARFDELLPGRAEGPTTAAGAARSETGGARVGDRVMAAGGAPDWESVAAAADFRVVDRRKLVRIELDRGEQQETLRFYFELRSSRFTEQLLATRGDRLALVRWRFEGSSGDVGA